MKRKIQLIFAAVLVLSLTACGVAQEKLDTAQSTYDELVALCDRTEAVCKRIEEMEESASYTDGSSDYSAFYLELQDYRDSYAEAMEGIKKMSEADVDALIASMQEEVNSASETVELLEEFGDELQTFVGLIEAVVSNTEKIEEILDNNPNEAFYNALQELVDHYSEIETKLLTLQLKLSGNDLNTSVSALQEVNTLITEYNDKIEATVAAFGG